MHACIAELLLNWAHSHRATSTNSHVQVFGAQAGASSHPEVVLPMETWKAAAATPQQQQQRSQPRVGLYDFDDWLLPNGTLDSEKCTTPEHVEVILQKWRMPLDAWPMTSDDPRTEVKNLCYSVKKESHEHEIRVLLVRQAFMTQGPGMENSFFSFWHRPDFEFGYVKRPHTLVANTSARGWNHREIHDAWQEAKCFAGWEQNFKSGLLKPISIHPIGPVPKPEGQERLDQCQNHDERFEVMQCSIASQLPSIPVSTPQHFDLAISDADEWVLIIDNGNGNADEWELIQFSTTYQGFV